MTSSGKPRKPKVFLIRQVAGRSMEPALVPGSVVLALNLPPRQHDIVIAWQAGREVIKRVHSRTADSIELRGDNPAHSTDSRNYGPVAVADTFGRVVVKFPSFRRGKL